MTVYHGSNQIITKPDVLFSIMGNVADDDVFKTIDMYVREIWDKKRTIEELRYYKMNNQICIVTQNVLDKVLTFQGSYSVEQK